MKLNKRDQLAVSALDKILTALSGGSTAFISKDEVTALTDSLGIDLLKSTFSRGQVNALVRGKDVPVVLIQSTNESNTGLPRNCFFPFQIKEHNTHLITCPRCHSHVRQSR